MYLTNTTFKRQSKHNFFTIIPVIYKCNTPPDFTSFRLESESCTQQDIALRTYSCTQNRAPLPAPSPALRTIRPAAPAATLEQY